jgi:Rieske Fe-S protein
LGGTAEVLAQWARQGGFKKGPTSTDIAGVGHDKRMRRRRSALRVLFKATGTAAAAAGGCVPPSGAVDNGPAPPVSLPAPVAGRITMNLADFPQLQTDGGLIGRSPGVTDPIAITFDTERRPLAVVATCTHMACPLRYNSLNLTLDCTCHGSTFETDGKVINGPAVKSLRVLPCELRGQLLDIKMT